MRANFDSRLAWVLLALLASSVLAIQGCSRTKYRLQADREAYDVIAERNHDPRWSAADPLIDIDPRSRYFDVYDADCPPMPQDDPASQRYMHVVDGIKGWKHWGDNGSRFELENSAWAEALDDYVEVSEKGSIRLDLDSALRLAYMHSPDHQSQLETLYLSALDVTAERFRLDTQFFGGYDANYLHQGSLEPARLSYNDTLGRFVITPAIDGVENNLLTVGRPAAANPALLLQRRFATAGELLVGFANSFVFEFTGADTNLSASLANFTFIQPLLRGAGKDVALEQLTYVERNLLANLRAYGQFRQGFYTQVAIGELGVTRPQRNGFDTNLQSFPGQGFVGGYLGLLRQLQQIRNSEDNLSLQLRTLARLEAFLDVDVIDRVQVEQFRQNIQDDRDQLLQSRVFFELAQDQYKKEILGLPPDLAIELDDTLIRQFQLIDPQATALQDTIVAFQRRAGRIELDVDLLGQTINDAIPLIEPIERRIDEARNDLRKMDEVMQSRERTMTEEEIMLLREEKNQLARSLLERDQEFRLAIGKLDRIRSELAEKTPRDSKRDLIVWVNDILGVVERTVLIQARARLEMVTVDPVELDPRDAFNIALANRLDFMNGRAALVDSWRLIQVNADALQSVLDVTSSGDIRTARNNPLSFRAPTGSLRLGLEFDAPFTRLLERNAYRESLITYQRSRRDFIQSRDSLNLGLRALLRQIEQLRTSLEIQRRAVSIAIVRVDLTQRQLGAPVPRAPPGQPPAQFNPTTAINLLSAQASLLSTQNRFLSVWLNYYAAQMRLARELGTMELDPDGRWMEETSLTRATESEAAPDVLERLPPAVPSDGIEASVGPGSFGPGAGAKEAANNVPFDDDNPIRNLNSAPNTLPVGLGPEVAPPSEILRLPPIAD